MVCLRNVSVDTMHKGDTDDDDDDDDDDNNNNDNNNNICMLLYLFLSQTINLCIMFHSVTADFTQNMSEGYPRHLLTVGNSTEEKCACSKKFPLWRSW